MSNFIKEWKKQSLCVFCDGPGLTKQHVWANQLNKIIVKVTPSINFIQTLTSIKEGKVHTEPSSYSRNGDPGTLQIRKVCEKCNNGWMKKIENDAIPDYIKPLILGESIKLNEEVQTKISSWLTLVTIMAEFTAEKQVCISKKERQELMNSKKPLSNWQIVIGKYPANEQLLNLYSHRMVMIADRKKPTEVEGGAQMTTNILGNFFFIAFCTVGVFPKELIIDIEDIYNSEGQHVFQIWPIKHYDLYWPPESPRDKDIIKFSSDLFANYLSLR